MPMRIANVPMNTMSDLEGIIRRDVIPKLSETNRSPPWHDSHEPLTWLIEMAV